VHATTGDTLNDFFVFNGDFNHGVQFDTGSHQGFSLGNGAREAVEQEAVGAVGAMRSLTSAMIRSSDTRPPASMMLLA
jgi:hypothetical protein